MARHCRFSSSRFLSSFVLVATFYSFGLSRAAWPQSVPNQSPQTPASSGSGVQAAAPATFLVAPTVALSGAPSSVAAGDLNGDGKLDLVIANFDAGKISVLLGQGNGQFAAAVDYPVGKHPAFVLTGDVNGDGKLDVVVCNEADGTVSILLGNGDGSLQNPTTYKAAPDPMYVAMGDFNADGKPDLAVAGSSSGTVTLLLNDGTGNFSKAVPYTIGRAPQSLTVADFDGDGIPDLVSANADGTINIMLSRGDGTFRAISSLSIASTSLSSIASGDFNGDGKTDLAITQAGTKLLTVLLGRGDGTFQTGSPYAVGSNPAFVVAADVNNDNIPDLITANQSGNTFSVLLGNGDGTFKQSMDFVAGNSPRALAAGDFNADGHPDLAIVNFSDRSISIASGIGDGTFKAARAYNVDLDRKSVAAGDLDGDGKPDLVVTNFCGTDSTCSSNGTVSVLLAVGDGTYKFAASYPLGAGPLSVALADVNGDKKLDLIAVNRGDKSVSVLLGNGDGTFQSALTYAAGNSPVSVAVGDFNKDGKPDLAIAGDCGSSACAQPGNVSVLFGNGDGSFQSAATYAVGYSPSSIVVGDVNGDGNLDVAVSNACGKDSSCQSNGTATLLLGDGKGAFTSGADVELGNSPSAVTLGDLNGDGVPDLVAAYRADNKVGVLQGKGDGTFKAQVTYQVGTAPSAVVVADFNGDGKRDVAVANLKDSKVSVLFGNGDGSLQTAVHYPVGVGPESLVAIDPTNSGHADLVSANGNGGVSPKGSDVTVLRNLSDIGSTKSTTLIEFSKPPNDPDYWGDALYFKATVTGDGVSGTPTGTVNFLANGQSFDPNCDNVALVTVDNNTATANCGSTLVPAGNPTVVTAAYSGDGTYAMSYDSLYQVVNKVDTVFTITTTGQQTIAYGQPSITLKGGICTPPPMNHLCPAGDTVTVSVENTNVSASPIIGGDGSFTAILDTHLIPASQTPYTIKYSYAGNNDFNPAPDDTTSTTLEVNPAQANIKVNGYTATYDGNPHTATGTATGANGEDLSKDLDLSKTTHTSANNYPNDPWTFHDPNGNYQDAAGMVNDKINQATATITVTPYVVTYDCNAHTAMGTATGVQGEDLSNDLDLSKTTNTKAGNYPNDSWSFKDPNGNYKDASGMVNDVINQAVANIIVNSYSVPYDSNPHTATGTATGVCGDDLSPDLDLSKTTHTNAGDYPNDPWSFHDSNGNYKDASGTVHDQIMKATTTVDPPTGNPASSTYLLPVTFTTAVHPQNGGTPSGTVGFTDGINGPLIPGCADLALDKNGQVPPCVTSTLTAGTHTIVANYSGDSNFSNSSNSSQYIVGTAATTTTIMAQPASPSNFGQLVTFTATVTGANGGTPTGTVDFADSVGGPIQGCTGVQLLGKQGGGSVAVCQTATLATGDHTITTNYKGDNNFGGGSGSISYHVNLAPTTATITAVPQGQASWMQPVVFTATITAISGGTPTGTVDFTDNNSPIMNCTGLKLNQNGQAQCPTSSLAVTTHTILVNYPGNSDFGTSNTSITYVVIKANTTTSLVSAPNPSDVNQFVLVTATISGQYGGAPTGQVTFTSDNKPISECLQPVKLINQQATCNTQTLGIGKHTITATYDPNGDPDFNGSNNTLQQTVNATPTTTTVSSSPNPSVSQQTVTFNITITPQFHNSTSPGGTVDLTDSGASVPGCTGVQVTSGQAMCSTNALQPGARTITATYNGDNNKGFQGSSASLEQTVQDFTVSLSTSSVAVIQGFSNSNQPNGQTITFTVTSISPNGFSKPLALSCSGLPTTGTPAPTCPFSPNIIQPPANGAANSTLTISLQGQMSGGLTTPGSYPLTITALDNTNDGSGLAHSASLLLTVVQNQPPVCATSQGQPLLTVSGYQTVTATFTCMDAENAATVSIDWGDGSNQLPPPTLGSNSIQHLYSSPGVYAVAVTATDNVNQTSIISEPVSQPNAVSVVAGSSVSTSMMVAALPGSVGSTVMFSCPAISGTGINGSEDPSKLGISCTFTPSSVVLASSPVAVQVTINTLVTTARLSTPAGILAAIWLGMPAIVFLGSLRFGKLSRKALLQRLGILLLLVGLLQSIGCGGGFKNTTPPSNNVTPAGVYSILVQGTDSSSGVVQSSVIVPVTVLH